MKKKYRILSSNGIDEKLFVNINGQNQYVFIRGKDVNNPIILNLHGGPANPDAFFTYEFAKEISEDFTYVSWDQRGCGRTYYKNRNIDSKNDTVDFEQALKDVDELVKYLCTRFKKDKVIIMGHSYGSLLGVSYVSKYPERVERYIGIGQSKINEQIRNLFNSFPIASYVGYTATPFANIFINPDDDENYLDLFPSDFIVLLNAPTNYFGASKVFAYEGKNNSRYIRELDESEKFFLPPKHKKDEYVFSTLPESLKEAILCFLINNVIRTIQGAEKKHRSMMINISVFNVMHI